MTENKPILAIETSGEICGAAVMFDEKKYAETNIRVKNVHSEKILDAVNSVLKATGTELKDMSAIAVSSGPGSFTGLRIGMSTAKGLAFGANLPVISVPAFDALALQISPYISCESRFYIINKVNIDEVYFAELIKRGKDKTEYIQPLKVMELSGLKEKLDTAIPVFGNGLGAEGNIAFPNAAYIAKWAYLFGSNLLSYDYDYMEPLYLKNFVIRKSSK